MNTDDEPVGAVEIGLVVHLPAPPDEYQTDFGPLKVWEFSAEQAEAIAGVIREQFIRHARIARQERAKAVQQRAVEKSMRPPSDVIAEVGVMGQPTI